MTLFAKIKSVYMYWTQPFGHFKEHYLSQRISSDAWSVLDQIHGQEQKVPTRAAYSWDASIKLQNYGMRLTLCIHIRRLGPSITVIRTHPWLGKGALLYNKTTALHYSTKNSPFVVHHSSNSSCQCLSSIRSPKSKFISIILLPQLSFWKI